jgi:uncharacterized DUF497 family protein
MRISCNRAKRERTLRERGLDMRRGKEVFAGLHLTRIDDRFDYGELRFITAGWLDSRLVVFAWTPRGVPRRIISMRHCHEREAKRLRPYFETQE